MTSNCNRFFLSFFWLSKVRFLIQYECMMPCNMSDLTFLTKRKRVTNIYSIRLVGGKVALIPIVSCSGMTYANMVSVPVEKHNRYIFTYITTYPPSGTRAFNVARTALHTLREYIHVLKKRPQDIPRSPHPMCVVVTSHTTNT
jgi:hypothetical protein